VYEHGVYGDVSGCKRSRMHCAQDEAPWGSSIPMSIPAWRWELDSWSFVTRLPGWTSGDHHCLLAEVEVGYCQETRLVGCVKMASGSEVAQLRRVHIVPLPCGVTVKELMVAARASATVTRMTDVAAHVEATRASPTEALGEYEVEEILGRKKEQEDSPSSAVEDPSYTIVMWRRKARKMMAPCRLMVQERVGYSFEDDSCLAQRTTSVVGAAALLDDYMMTTGLQGGDQCPSVSVDVVLWKRECRHRCRPPQMCERGLVFRRRFEASRPNRLSPFDRPSNTARLPLFSGRKALWGPRKTRKKFSL
jgi:hypothetical protein